MTPERFAAVKSCFAAVAELPPAARGAHLCALTDDPEVVAEVLALVDAGTGTAGISAPIAVALADAVSGLPAPGDTLGVWRIERELGQGGMGSVFLAERSDGHFRQQAAVKFLRGIPAAEALMLFTRERQLLATLTHPNIGRLLDGGATPQGRPYLVMEYVEGSHIDEHCRRHELGVRAVLVLFLTVCNAVASAHRQLVIHCDLKPSNLLVDGHGRPVLLDFGIARLADRVGAESAGVDGEGSTPGFTPRYASPEQRSHGPVTTASDIYSLGVLLGELLAGAADRRRSSALTRRELAALVARATREEPAERYATVDALTADIRRFLDRQPLQALHGTAGYRLRKLLSRRWPAVAAGLVFLCTVGASTGKVVLETRRAQAAERTALAERDRSQVAERDAVRERDATRLARLEALRERDRARRAERRAVAERNRAAQAETSSRQVSEFLVSIFDHSNPTAESGDIRVSQLLAQAEARVERELAGQPALQAELYSSLARVQANMGRPEQARVDSLRALALERPQGRPLILAEMLDRHAALLDRTFNTPEAEPTAREAVALRERYAPNTEAHAASLAILASIISNYGKAAEAQRLLDRSLAIRERLDPAGLGTADTLLQQGAVSDRAGDLPRALAALRRSLEIRVARLGKEHPDSLDVALDLGRTLLKARRFDEAEALLEEALRQRRRLHGDDNELVAELLQQLASLLAQTGRTQESLALYREVVGIRERTQGKSSPGYGLALFNLAATNQWLGDDATVVVGVREALAVLRPHWAENNPGTPRMRLSLAHSLLRLGRVAEAEAELRQALAVSRVLFDERSREVYMIEVPLAECELRQGRLEDARARLDRLAAVAPTLPVRDQLPYRRQKALLAAALGDVQGAAQELAAIEVEDEGTGRLPFQIWSGKVYRAELLVRRGNPDQQAAGRALAREIREKLTPLMVPEAPVLRRLEDLLR